MERVDADAGRAYWRGVDADINGMLDGRTEVSQADLDGSREFLAKLGIGSHLPGLRKIDRVLEGGAGIGRVTKGLLLTLANTVDIVEPEPKFTDVLKGEEGVGQILNIGIEEWVPSDDSCYDLFWNQWCLCHLTDDQVVSYMQRCATRLNDDNSLIIVKENQSGTGHDLYDEVDSTVARDDSKFRRLFEEAGLQIVRTNLQRGMPKDLLALRMYALRPLGQTQMNKRKRP